MMAEFPAATEVITNRRCNQTMGSSVDSKHLTTRAKLYRDGSFLLV